MLTVKKNEYQFISTVQLNWQEKDNIVTVIPENKDLFYITVEKAIRACHAYENTAAFHDQFDNLLNKLAQWIKAFENDVNAAFITVRDAGLLFLVVKKSLKYDDEFENNLTDLDLEIAQDVNFNKIKLSVLAIPRIDIESIKSFLAPGATLRYSHA